MGANTLTLMGLILNVVAVMFYFPPRVLQFDEDGRAIAGIALDPRPEKARARKWQVRLAGIGPLLLFAGFLLQLAGVICGWR
jgi:hypothetical protein